MGNMQEELLTNAEESAARLRELQEENTTLREELRKKTEDYENVLNEKKALEEIATRDPLTKLYNPRGLAEGLKTIARLSPENKERRGGKKPTAVLVLDIDELKEINDTYGHLKTNQALRDIARLLTETVRRGDIVCRWLGDEFIIVFRNATAQDIIDKFHKDKETAGLSFHVKINGEEKEITMSGGVTELRLNEFATDEAALDDAIARADEALYVAKGKGEIELRMQTRKQSEIRTAARVSPLSA